MRKVITYFLLLLIVVWFGVTAMHNDGYILISYRDFSIETSLWFALLILGITFCILYILLRFGSIINSIATRTVNWFNNHWLRRARTQTFLGLYEMVEGNWIKAEKRLLRHAKYSDIPLINCVAAAFIAQNRRDFKRRDYYLRLISQLEKNHSLAIKITQIFLYFNNKQWQEAQNILQQIYQQSPKNVLILQLLQKVYWELKDWRSLEKLLLPLKKYHVLSNHEFSQLEHTVYKELLYISVKNSTIDSNWHRLPRYLRFDAELAAIYADYLLKNKKMSDAEEILKIALHRNLNTSLLTLYTQLRDIDPIKQLMRAEKWLQTNQENPSLLLCLGRLCHQQKLWGKARNHLEKSAKLAPCTVVYGELARIAIEQNDVHRALNFYAKGMRFLQ